MLKTYRFRYKGYRRPIDFRDIGESYAVVLDSEKGNIFDVRFHYYERRYISSRPLN